MTPDQAPAGSVCCLKVGTSQWAREFNARVLEWGFKRVKLYPGGWKSADETEQLTVVHMLPSKESQPAHLLAEAVDRLDKIRRLVVDGVSAGSNDHKQFYLSQVLKLVDSELWKQLEDKGTPP